MGFDLSEFVRSACLAVIEDGVQLGVDDGYRQARGLAINLAFAILREAVNLLPPTYEEAITRYPTASATLLPPEPAPEPELHPEFSGGYE